MNFLFSFPDTHTWEQRRLGDISKSFSGGTPFVGDDKNYNGGIPFIRSAEIHSEYTELFISEFGLKNSSTKKVERGDILYALYGATSGEVDICKINGAINQAILAIKPYENYSSQFIVQQLAYKKQKIINTFLQGGQGNLSADIVKKIDIFLGNFEEQTQIGNFFQSFDNLIALHQRKLFYILYLTLLIQS